MLRPSYLKEGRAAFEQGGLSVRELKRLEDRAVDQVIAMQEGAGVDVVSDGEMRRFLFMGPITETVEGIEFVEHDQPMPWNSPEGELEWLPPAAVTSKLRKRRSMVTEEYSYARARARLPLKVTVPSPLVLYGLWSPKHSSGAYSDPFAMFAEGVELINSMVEGISGVRLGIHLCRGNNAGMWMASGGYDYIAKALFERATGFDAFFLEYDDARSGSFEPIA